MKITKQSNSFVFVLFLFTCFIVLLFYAVTLSRCKRGSGDYGRTG